LQVSENALTKMKTTAASIAPVENAIEEIHDRFKGSFALGGVTALKRFPPREARLAPFPDFLATRLVEIL